MNYNLKRHVELLKQDKTLLSQNKSFFKENRRECLELSKYNVAVSEHIFWENRFKVASIIQAFLNKKMDAQEFHVNEPLWIVCYVHQPTRPVRTPCNTSLKSGQIIQHH